MTNIPKLTYILIGLCGFSILGTLLPLLDAWINPEQLLSVELDTYTYSMNLSSLSAEQKTIILSILSLTELLWISFAFFMLRTSICIKNGDFFNKTANNFQYASISLLFMAITSSVESYAFYNYAKIQSLIPADITLPPALFFAEIDLDLFLASCIFIVFARILKSAQLIKEENEFTI